MENIIPSGERRAVKRQKGHRVFVFLNGDLQITKPRRYLRKGTQYLENSWFHGVIGPV